MPNYSQQMTVFAQAYGNESFDTIDKITEAATQPAATEGGYTPPEDEIRIQTIEIGTYGEFADTAESTKNDGKSFVFEKYIFSLMDSIQTSFHTGEHFRRYFQITRKKFGFYFTKYQNSCIMKKIACKLCLYAHRRIAPEMEVNRQQFSLPETVRHACMPMTHAARNRGTGTTCDKLLWECP